MQETQNSRGEPVALRFNDAEAETILAGLRIYKYEVELDGGLHPENVDQVRLEQALVDYDDFVAQVMDGRREATDGFEIAIVKRGLELLQHMHEQGMAAGARVYKEFSSDFANPAVLTMHGMGARRMLETIEVIPVE